MNGLVDVGETKLYYEVRGTGPSLVLVGNESPPFFAETASWIAARAGNDVVQVPGGHVDFIDHTREFAEVVRPLIGSMA